MSITSQAKALKPAMSTALGLYITDALVAAEVAPSTAGVQKPLALIFVILVPAMHAC